MAEAAKTRAPTLAVVEGRELPAVNRGNDWRLLENVSNGYRAIVAESVEVEDLTNERLWLYVANDLHPMDRINVVRADRKFWADLLVIDAVPGAARVVVLNVVSPLPPMIADFAPEALRQYDVHQDGIRGGWYARRISDGAEMILEPGLRNRQEVETFLANHASNRRY